MSDWISVDEQLPEKDEWVLVFENDHDNPQDEFINNILGNRKHTRVRPAKVNYIDSEGYAAWYCVTIGGGPAGNYRNVTHWMPLPTGPISQPND